MFWLVAALGLLYAWLMGWWFARIPMTIMMAIFLVVFGSRAADPQSLPMAYVYIIGCLPIAWLLSGLPHYVRNRRVTAKQDGGPIRLYLGG